MPTFSLLKARGLQTFQNQLAAPEGSLLEADDVVINRDNVVEPRRGFDNYGDTFGLPSARSIQLLEYKNRIIRHYSTTLQYDNGSGTFAALSGSYSSPDSSLRIKNIEANGNLYFTSSEGIKKLSLKDSSEFATATIKQAGGVKALDGKATLNSQEGWFTQDSVVAYRILWGIKDANSNLIYGTPSERIIVSNPLISLLINDFNNLLTVLDTEALPCGINDGNYSSLAVATNASAVSLKSSLQSLCSKIDTDTVITSSPSLRMSSQSVQSNTGYVVFDNTVSSYIRLNDKIKISNLTSTAGNINGYFTVKGYSSYIKDSDTLVFDVGCNNFSDTQEGAVQRVKYTLNPYREVVSDEVPISTVSAFIKNSNAYVTFAADVSSYVSVGDTVTLSGFTDSSLTQLNNTFVISGIQKSVAEFDTIQFSIITGDVSTVSQTSGKMVLQASDLDLTLSTTPTTQQLQALQSFYDSIVLGLIDELDTIATASKYTSSNAVQSSTVDISFTIPDEVTTAHFFQIYRSPMATSEGTTTIYDQVPSDEMNLVYESNPTTTDISNKEFSLALGTAIHDIQPDDLRAGADYLYTNPNTGEGINQANEVPPLAKDIAYYKGFTFYSDTKTRQRLQISLLGTLNLSSTSSHIRVSCGSTSQRYSFGPAENVATNTAFLPTSDEYSDSQKIDLCARSLVHLINLTATNLVYAYYISGSEDIPGKILLEARDLSGGQFNVVAEDTLTGESFQPNISPSAEVVDSDNEQKGNRLYYSKYQQPEAVPSLNYIDIGPGDKRIIRILGLRDSLFVFKEEGIYRVAGDTTPFTVYPFDFSTQIKGADTAAILNNQIYLNSNQGISRVSESGVEIISRPIENRLIRLKNLPNFSSASFGVPYESDRAYFFWTVTYAADTVATQFYRFNTFTNTWTRGTKPATCGLVASFDDKLYIGSTDSNTIKKERKNFDRTDYADESLYKTLLDNSIGTDTLFIADVTDIDIGDVLVQTQYLTIYRFNQLLTMLDSDPRITDKTYLSSLQAETGDNLRSKVTSLAVKLDADPDIIGTDYTSSISSYGTTFANTQSAYNVIVNKLNTDDGVAYSTYPTDSGTTDFEVDISNVNKSRRLVYPRTMIQFITGPITVYKHIDSLVIYPPQVLGDPTTGKHVSEATFVFENDAFTEVVGSFASDVSPEFESISFGGSGNGIFGSGEFGTSYVFGGGGYGTPFRTYIPQQKQRCRYIKAKFEHGVARENFALYGLTLKFTPYSTRTNK